MRSNPRRIAQGIIGSVLAVSFAASAHAHGDNFSAGEPGDPRKTFRSIFVTATEKDGRMVFIPNRIEVRRGEQVKFIIRNTGETDHEFILATRQENIKHAEEMRKNPDMEHDEPNGKKMKPKQSAEIIWKFTKTGTFEYGCLIPGHHESGMHGTIIVK
jgi:uncharacterized cupredoxin-like copper-binding protein